MTIAPFGKPEHVAQAGGDHLLDLRVGEHFLHDVRRSCRARRTLAPESTSWCFSSRAVYIGLVFTTVRPARRMPKVAIGVLQAVGHHDRDAIALLQFQLAEQVGRELLAQAIDLGVGEHLAEVGERGAVAVLLERGLQHRDDRRKFSTSISAGTPCG